MDQIDIDNVEDLNELESRLYAQIHHEATEEASNDNVSQNDGVNINSNNKDTSDTCKNYETSTYTNRVLSRRYWASGQNSKEQEQQYQQNTNQRFVRNPFKTPNPQNQQHKNDPPSSSAKSQNQQQQAKQIENQSNIATKTNEHFKSAQQNSKLQEGPFAKRHEKLQNLKHLEDKSTPETVIDLDTDNESDCSDIIMLPIAPTPTYTLDDSGDEDNKVKVPTINEHLQISVGSSFMNNSADKRLDNLLRCTSPCSTHSFDDLKAQKNDGLLSPRVSGATDDDEDLLGLTTDMKSLADVPEVLKQKVDNEINVKQEGNILDSSLEHLPEEIVETNDLLEVPETEEVVDCEINVKQEEIMLGCNEENIEINDHLEASETSKEAVDVEIIMKHEEGMLGSNVNNFSEDIVEFNDSLEFATLKSSQQQSCAKDDRVEQGQFRHLDFYDSETEITERVMCNEANKTTVIRQIDTSSDEVDDIGSCSSQRTKRLPKRNKESDSDIIIVESLSSSNNETDEDVEEDDNKVLRTPVPFIARGPAVERYIPRKRNRTLSNCFPIIHKQKTAKTPALTGSMSDTGFIATLNSLAQTQEDALAKEGCQQVSEEDVESETENTPTARDIAEKILCCHNDKEKSKNTSAVVEMSVTEDVLNELDEVFESIDQLDGRNARRTKLSANNDTVEISDSCDSDLEMHCNEDAEIIVL